MAPKTKQNPAPFVGVTAAAKRLGLSVRSTQSLIVYGHLKATKPNGGITSAYIIASDELDRFERDEAELLVSRRAAAQIALKSARARKAAAK